VTRNKQLSAKWTVFANFRNFFYKFSIFLYAFFTYFGTFEHIYNYYFFRYPLSAIGTGRHAYLLFAWQCGSGNKAVQLSCAQPPLVMRLIDIACQRVIWEIKSSVPNTRRRNQVLYICWKQHEMQRLWPTL